MSGLLLAQPVALDNLWRKIGLLWAHLSSFETVEEEPAVVGSARSLSAQAIIF